MVRRFKSNISEERVLKTIKVEEHVHAWLVLLAEKYRQTLSGSIEHLIMEHEADVVALQRDIERLKEQRLERVYPLNANREAKSGG